jgi:endo-1,4-beta-xylanase
MPSVRVIIAALIMPLILSSCGSGAVPASPTAVSTNTPQVFPTLEKTPTPTRNLQWATYQNSFEDLSSATASGFAAIQSDLPASQSSLKINGDLAATGKQSLEVSGTIAGQGSTWLSVEFPIKSLTGEGTIDFSETAMEISVFIPKDSPIDGIDFGFSAGSKSIVVPVTGYGVEIDRWFKEGIDLRRASENPGTIIWGSSWDAAKDIFRNCETVSIVGMRNTEGGSLPASFLVDDLGWADAPDPFGGLATDPNADSLRKYADTRNLKVGSVLQTAVPHDYLMDPSYPGTLAREFNLLWGNESGWPTSQPADPATNDFNYSYSDEALEFAQANHLAVKNFAGGWYLVLPVWLMETPFNQLQPILQNRIAKDVGRYQGKIFLWDVFDEVVDDNGNGFRNRQKKNVGNPPPDSFAPYGYHYSPWVDGDDTSLIQAAFRKARETDPSAKLFLNEYDNEQIGTRKSEACYQFVKALKQEGVPIDGIGFQLHLWIQGNTVGTYQDRGTFDAYLEKVRQNVKRYSDLGVLVEFSEVELTIRTDDIDFSTPAGKETYQKRLQDQAYVYAGLMKIAVENKNVAAFIFWAVSDPWSSTQTVDYPTHEVFGDSAPFDSFYQPKPA